MSKDCVLGIDVGTSGVRIAASDRSGALLAMSKAPIIAPIQNSGRSLQDPRIWWDAVEQAFALLELKGLNVLAIAIDGTSGTILPVDRNGEPLGLASMYNDLAERGDVDKVSAAAPMDTAARGGSSPLARALPMQKGATRILHQADWLSGRFSGRYDVSDENNALKSGYDPIARIWPSWIAGTGFDIGLFPNVVPAGMATGIILPDIAEKFGLSKTLCIVAGTTDGCAAFLASGAAEPGDGVTSLGTTLTLKLLSDRPVFSPQYGIYSHRIGDQWLAGGASNSGGGVLWKYFSGADIARLSELVDPNVPTALDYYPLPQAGERFPIADPHFEPRLSPRPDDDRLFFQGLLEGIAQVEAQGYARLAELGATPLKSIRSVGGGAANGAWTRIRLKTLGVTEKPSASEHAAMGTARLAWRGIGHAH
ncbi:MAG: FGGY-family carbohydrate kinase [Aestuariivirga sp.]